MPSMGQFINFPDTPDYSQPNQGVTSNLKVLLFHARAVVGKTSVIWDLILSEITGLAFIVQVWQREVEIVNEIYRLKSIGVLSH